MEILKAMFNKAEAWGYLPDHSNPFRGVKRNRGRKIERFLSAAEGLAGLTDLTALNFTVDADKLGEARPHGIFDYRGK